MHPPLTPEQIAFLRGPASALDRLPGMDGAAMQGWWSTMSMFRLLRVWDVVEVITHLQSGDEIFVRLRKAIEAVVGTLPLALSVDELQRITLTDRALVRLRAKERRNKK